MSYLSDIYLELLFSWLGGGVHKSGKKKKKTDRRGIQGPISEKWNQIAIFKNSNKLHKSSWVIIDRTS